MPAIVAFDTLGELFLGLSRRFRGTRKTSFAFKPPGNKKYEPLTWDDFSEDVCGLAAWLKDEGIEKGDRVAILSENRYEWAIVDMAIQTVGAINVALYTSLPPAQCEYILNDSGSKFFFVSTGIQQRKAIGIFERCKDLRKVIAFDVPKDESLLKEPFMTLFSDVMNQGRGKLDEYRQGIETGVEAVTPEDIATLIYTSGTTGRPKGVMLTHRNIVSNIKAGLQVIDIGENDRVLSFLPLCHAFERTGGYYCVLAGGAEIYYAESVDTVARNMVEVGPTLVVSVPRLFERIYTLVSRNVKEGSAMEQRIFEWALRVGRKYEYGSRGFASLQRRLADRLVFDKLRRRTGGNIKFFVSGGAALSPEVGGFFRAAGIKILEGYGLTETSPIISVNLLEDPRVGSVGPVLPGVTVGIRQLTDGKIIAEVSGGTSSDHVSSEAGEIVCKGPNVMKGYWGKPEDTREAIDRDGWFHTGDIGRFEQGHLKITDRLKHMIVNSGGKNIYPGPIEDLLKTSVYIDQAVVVGEKQNYMTTLIVPDMEQLHRYAAEHQLKAGNDRELLDHPEIIGLYEHEIKRFSAQLPSHEKIRRFKLLNTEFTIESGELTPTLKIRRRIIEQRYAAEIAAMYESERSQNR